MLNSYLDSPCVRVATKQRDHGPAQSIRVEKNQTGKQPKSLANGSLQRLSASRL
jgi:hypothetical protein